MKKMLLVSPSWGEHGLSSISAWKWPSLALSRIAEITPTDWEVDTVDENFNSIEWEKSYDLVALSAMTPLAPRAYEIARIFRERGIAVIMGGIHASMCSEEAMRFVDCVVTGEADAPGFWAGILNDFKNDCLKKIYHGGQAQKLAEPVRYVSKTFSNKPISFLPVSVKIASIQTQRGCHLNCEFCSVHLFSGTKIRSREIDDVIKEIKLEKENNDFDFLFFVDDNIVADRTRARNLFEALKPLKIRWFSQTDITIAEDDILPLAIESGMMGVFIGFESVNPVVFKNGAIGRKKQKLLQRYEENIKKLKRGGVQVLGAFIFGFDGDTSDSVDITIEWAIKNKIDFGQFFILTPLPGTRMFKKFQEADRLIESSWDQYDMCRCVYKPKDPLTKEYLDTVSQYAYKKFHGSPWSILKRLREAKFSTIPYLFFANLEFARFKP